MINVRTSGRINPSPTKSTKGASAVPTTKSSAYIRNNYNELSELYRLLDTALEEEKNGKFMDYDDFMSQLWEEIT
ncbi:MAG: hypothetical protein FWG87_08530 [Defluviitaleaceae bacterium]|nr:hypothetical protein [Defluviitaleaceae bacterium]